MHEMAITESVVVAVSERIAPERAVWVVGRLWEVVPDALAKPTLALETGIGVHP